MKKTTKKNTTIRLEATYHEKALCINRFEAEFTTYPYLDLEAGVKSGLKYCFESITSFALEGYEKYGRGFVQIEQKCYSGRIHWLDTLARAKAKYISAGSMEFENFSKPYLIESYDPEKEIVFSIKFYDGLMDGVIGFEEMLEKLKAMNGELALS